jgi:hypothetical protein
MTSTHGSTPAERRPAMASDDRTTIRVKGHGEFTATARMRARFEAISKIELVKLVAQHYEGQQGAGVAHWRTFPKDTLVIVAADMLATDAERGVMTVPAPSAALEPVSEPTDLDDGTQNPERGEAPASAEPVSKSPKPQAEPKGTFVLKVSDGAGWLRREQPRKPGDSARYRVVEEAKKATVYRTERMAALKLAESVALASVAARVVEVR